MWHLFPEEARSGFLWTDVALCLPHRAGRPSTAAPSRWPRMQSTPGPAARPTVSVGLKSCRPSTHSSAAWDPQGHPTPLHTHTPLVQNQTLKGAHRERQEAKVPPHPAPDTHTRTPPRSQPGAAKLREGPGEWREVTDPFYQPSVSSSLT